MVEELVPWFSRGYSLPFSPRFCKYSSNRTGNWLIICANQKWCYFEMFNLEKYYSTRLRIYLEWLVNIGLGFVLFDYTFFPLSLTQIRPCFYTSAAQVF